MVSTDLIVGTLFGALSGAIVTIIANHLLKEFEQDWARIYQPMYSELKRTLRVLGQGPASIGARSDFPGEIISAIEDEGRLLPERHSELKTDLDQLEKSWLNVCDKDDNLHRNLDISTHIAFEKRRKSDPEGLISAKIVEDLEYFVRCEINGAIRTLDEHRWRTIAYRAWQLGHIDGSYDVLWPFIEDVVREVEDDNHNLLVDRDKSLNEFHGEVDAVRARLETSLKSKGLKRYKHVTKDPSSRT